MMDRIALSVEADPEYQTDMREHTPEPEDTTADSVSLGACQMAYNLSAKIIVTFTSSAAPPLNAWPTTAPPHLSWRSPRLNAPTAR